MKRGVAYHVAAWWMLFCLALAGPVLAAEQPYNLDVDAGTVAGTLDMPAASANKPPVVLIIAGSGPTDRDGNSALLRGNNDSLKMLAAALADAGYASVRYDKRGIGASRALLKDEATIRFDTYVDDAVAWVAKLKADGRFGPVIVLGHSEGALIGAIAARRGGAAAFVSLAGSGETLAMTLRRQLAGKLPPDLAAANERILATLEHGDTTADVPQQLMPFYRPSVQPYLVSTLKYVPADQIAQVRVPTLIVQGTGDIQIRVEDARALKAAKPDAELVVIPDMNHVLKDVPAGSAAAKTSYADPALPLHPKLAPAIVGFLSKLPGR